MKLVKQLVVTDGDTIPLIAKWNGMWLVTRRGGWSFVLPWRLWNERMKVESTAEELFYEVSENTTQRRRRA